MKNLLYIGNHLSQSGKTVTTVETLGKALSLEGYSVTIASRKNHKVMRLIDMLYHIVKYTTQIDYVLIDTYSTQNFYYAYLCSQLCRLLKLKYIPILHGGNLKIRLKNNPKLSRQLFYNAHKSIAPTMFAKSTFEHFGYTNVVCIPNSIELRNYPFKERKFDEVKLLWVRSFSKIYNCELAVKILKALQEEGIRASLCMVGPDSDGSLGDVKALAQKLQVAVTFTGKLSKADWIALSNDYTIFINTTNFDNMPVSVIEAMALGLPVISTNVGGMPYLIAHEKDGILVPPGSVVDFVDAIKLITSDSVLYERIVRNARLKVEHYDWSLIKLQWAKLLK